MGCFLNSQLSIFQSPFLSSLGLNEKGGNEIGGSIQPRYTGILKEIWYPNHLTTVYLANEAPGPVLVFQPVRYY